MSIRLPFIPLLAAAGTAIIVLLGTFELREHSIQEAHNAEQEIAASRLSLIASTLSQTVNIRLNHTRSLAAFVRTNPDFTHEDFDRFATVLQSDLVGLRSLQLAPGGIVTYLTNLEQNRSALGHDLFADPKRRPLVERAVKNREYVIAGPINLVQGGKAIIARRPIYDVKEAGFWGFATVLIDVEPLLIDAGYTQLTNTYDLAIRGKDGLGASGEVFIGDEAVFRRAIAVADVVLPGGSWRIAAALPNDHAHTGFVFTDGYWILVIVAALLASYAMFIVIDRPGRLKAEVDRATADLIEARDAAEAANVAKTEFVAVVSHELRTPLTAIKGSLEMMQSGVAGTLPDRASEMVTIAARNSKRLLMLVNEILDMNKLLSGEVTMVFDPIPVGSLLTGSVDVNRPYAESFDVRLHIENDTADVMKACVCGDSERLEQVLTNLISNAVKFSDKGGTVELSASPAESGDRITIAVADNGPGIPEEFRDRVFERFTQANASNTRRSGGTGLGLYICKLIVNQHGGEIRFETELGSGTTFYIDLPRYRETAS